MKKNTNLYKSEFLVKSVVSLAIRKAYGNCEHKFNRNGNEMDIVGDATIRIGISLVEHIFITNIHPFSLSFISLFYFSICICFFFKRYFNYLVIDEFVTLYFKILKKLFLSLDKYQL